MTVHRSAAIIRMPGSAPVRWHTDWKGFTGGPPRLVCVSPEKSGA